MAGQGPPPFLKSLLAILEDKSALPYIRWKTDEVIEIVDIGGLEEHVLLRYFKTNKASSFTR
jgi:HSF-type DNA-binding